MFVLHSCYAAGTGHLLSRQLNRMHKWNKDQYMIFNSHYHIEIGATEAWQKHESHQTSNTIKKFEVWNVDLCTDVTQDGALRERPYQLPPGI